MAKYINPFVDFGFKYIFGREESKPFLMAFLNSLLASEPGFDPIVELEYQDKEQSRTGKEVRGVVYDIHCTTSDGKRFVVVFSDKLRYIFIQTPLFDKKTPGECVTNFDKWMYNIINMPTMDAMAFVDEKLFDDFEKMASYAALSPVDRMAYDANVKAYRDLMGQLEYASMEGEERGEAKTKRKMILNMAKEGISLDLISSVSGLSIDEVRSILALDSMHNA